jgi:hypothetical protein
MSVSFDQTLQELESILTHLEKSVQTSRAHNNRLHQSLQDQKIFLTTLESRLQIISTKAQSLHTPLTTLKAS